MSNPIQILNAAIQKVPFVKYALGVAGIAASVAIIKSFGIEDYSTIPVISILIMLGFMVLLFLFASLTTVKDKVLKVAGYILIYTTVTITCISSVFLVTSVFFDRPKPITKYGIFAKDKVDTPKTSNDTPNIPTKKTPKDSIITKITKPEFSPEKTGDSSENPEKSIMPPVHNVEPKKTTNWKDKYSKIENINTEFSRAEKVVLTENNGQKFSKYTYGIVNNEGKEIIESIYEDIKFNPLSVNFFVKKNGFWGIVDKYGGLITQVVYNEIFLPSEGFYRFQNYRSGAGFLRLDGTEFISGFGECRDFKEGMAAVSSRNTGQWGYINNKGELAIGYYYERAEDFSEGTGRVYYTPKYEIKQTVRFVKKNGNY